MIIQKYNLNMIPGKVPVMVRVSQYDQYSRTIIFTLYDGSLEYEIPNGSTISVRGTKPDHTGFEYPCTFEGNKVSFNIEPQQTVLSGLVPSEIRITSNNEIVGSCNFIINVEPTPLDESTVISDTDLPLIEEASQAAVIAQGAAARAEAEADRAEQVLSTAVKSVNGELPDASGNVEVETGGVPSGGTRGQIIVKLSSEDGDVEWQDNNKMDFVQSPTANDILLVNRNGQAIDSGEQLSQLQKLLTAGRGIQINNNVISNVFETVSGDLSTITYNFQGYAVGATDTPTGVNGQLCVLADAGSPYCTQIFSPYDTNVLYTRKYINGTWTDWKKLIAEPVELWKNASPDTSFSPQTLTLDLRKYSFAVIQTKIIANSTPYINSVIRINGYDNIVLGKVNNSAEIKSRLLTVRTNNIQFYNAYTGTTLDNNSMIPFKIWGL